MSRTRWAQCHATQTASWRSSASTAAWSRNHCLAVRRSDPQRSRFRIPFSVSPARPRWPWTCLDAAADLVDGVPDQRLDVEGVEDGGGVFELVVDGVLVSVEGIEGGDLHLFLECFAAGVEPGLVHRPRPARDEVEQPRSDVSILVTSQIQHAGQLLGAPVAGADVVQDVLVDP